MANRLRCPSCNATIEKVSTRLRCPECKELLNGMKGWSEMKIFGANVAINVGDFLTAKEKFAELAKAFEGDPQSLEFKEKSLYYELKHQEQSLE